MYEIKSCDFIYQHIKKHHIPQKYDSFFRFYYLRISKLIEIKEFSLQSNSSQRNYEEIYNRNIDDASIHQYDVSRG